MNENKVSENGFFGWIRSLNITRNLDDRWLGGVASGLAKKANLDPLIMRGILVVLALVGGPGIFVYLALWALMPDASGKIALQEFFSGREKNPWLIALMVVFGVWITIVVLAGFVMPGLGVLRWNLVSVFGLPDWQTTLFAWGFWIAVLLLIGFVIHRAVIARGQKATNKTENSAERVSKWAEDFSENINAKTDAWSQKYAEEHKKFALEPGFVLISIALALLAGSATVLFFHFYYGSLSMVSIYGALLPGLIVASATLAVAMIVAGLRGKKSGSVGFLGFLTSAALLVGVMIPTGGSFHFVGSDEATPLTGVSSTVLFGDIDADLSGIDKNQRSAVLNLGFGDVALTVPKDRPVYVSINSGAGRLTEFYGGAKRDRSGVLTHHSLKINESSKGEPLSVTLSLIAGNVLVKEAK